MEVPDLVRNVLGDEEIETSVRLGEEDTVYLTGTRTLLYRAEGLLSEQRVEEFAHDVDRLDVSEGRRKTKFILEYVDGPKEFTVPSSCDGAVFELLMTGILRAAGVAAPDEGVSGAFRFSELVLLVTETSVVKHIGSSVWTDDFEVYRFADLTGLSFERGNVATEIVVEIDGRPNRIKTPNERAREVQQVLKEAVFAYYGVSSLEQLNEAVGQSGQDGADDSRSSDIDIGGGLDPLVTDSEESTVDASTDAPTAEASSATEQARAETTTETASSTGRQEPTNQATQQATGSATDQQVTGDDVAALKKRLDELTAVVNRQSELLEAQQETINRLIAELRDGRG